MVIHTVLNRTEDPNFPDTIIEVLEEGKKWVNGSLTGKGQFHGYSPNYPVTEEIEDIVRLALVGEEPVNTPHGKGATSSSTETERRTGSGRETKMSRLKVVDSEAHTVCFDFDGSTGYTEPILSGGKASLLGTRLAGRLPQVPRHRRNRLHGKDRPRPSRSSP